MEAVGFLAAVAVLGILTQKIVERIRTVLPVNGNWTSLAALAVGSGLAYAFGLDPSVAISDSVGVPIRDFPAVVDYVIAGGFIGSAAGYFADRAGRSNGDVVIE